ncbi:MAG TPA: hypothetical protein VK469_22125 [Candidatus Kapabacteria bacterium]|nr:hypothetical protein [Candidatus Kapabacteria bacterium]
MNLRKSSYFKPLCLLVAALFTCQCISIEKKLVSTEEKVIEDESREFIYELEKIKAPSAQDPTIEYKIVKFPAKRVETIFVFEQGKKVNRFFSSLGIIVASAAIGSIIGQCLIEDACQDFGKPIFGFVIGTLTGALGSGVVVDMIKKKVDGKKEVKAHAGSHLEKKLNSPPLSLQNFPLEFKWETSGKSNTFKTQTDEQGIVRINLVTDLKITKIPPDRPLTLYILYFNPESQRKGIFNDSLGPEK